MEIFLNFVWVLMFVPAWWAWRTSIRRRGSVRCLLTLGCVLVILFPVISATDDLHAAPQALEECSSTKRTLKQGNTWKSANFCNPPAADSAMATPLPGIESKPSYVDTWSDSTPVVTGTSVDANRAPPSHRA